MKTIAVVGLGYVGLPLAVEFGKKFRTIGLDLSAEKVASYKQHIDPTGEVSSADLKAATLLEVGTDPAALREADFPLPGHHASLLANCLAQSAALAFGQTLEEVRAAGIAEDLVPYKVFPGNQPSNTLLLPSLTAYSLGQLLALFEHKVFCLGVLWNLNAFDQWGVELGKQLAGQLTPLIEGNGDLSAFDSSTQGLIAALKG